MIIRTICYVFFMLKIASSLPNPELSNLSPYSPSMNQLENIDVKCGRTGMSVTLTFNKPFEGIVFSKGFFHDPKCRYKNEDGRSAYSYRFWIPSNGCGTDGNFNRINAEGDLYYKNTVVIQNDPIVQEVWDAARILKCSWKQNMQKSIQTDPILVQGPKKVDIRFDYEALNTLTNIESSKRGSFLSSPISGYISDTENDKSIVIYVQDSTSSYDANIVSCYWRSEGNQKVKLIDANGCLLRPDLISQFEKVKNPNGIEADLQMYASLESLDLSSDPQFSVTCSVEICESNCLPSCALGPVHNLRKRFRRNTLDTGVSHSRLVPKGIVLFSDQLHQNTEVCLIEQAAAITVTILFFLVLILGCLSAYLAIKLIFVKKQLAKYINSSSY